MLCTEVSMRQILLLLQSSYQTSLGQICKNIR